MILKKYAGPVASMMIDDVLDDLYPKYPSGIAVDIFAQAVASPCRRGKRPAAISSANYWFDPYFP